MIDATDASAASSMTRCSCWDSSSSSARSRGPTGLDRAQRSSCAVASSSAISARSVGSAVARRACSRCSSAEGSCASASARRVQQRLGLARGSGGQPRARRDIARPPLGAGRHRLPPPSAALPHTSRDHRVAFQQMSSGTFGRRPFLEQRSRGFEAPVFPLDARQLLCGDTPHDRVHGTDRILVAEDLRRTSSFAMSPALGGSMPARRAAWRNEPPSPSTRIAPASRGASSCTPASRSSTAGQRRRLISSTCSALASSGDARANSSARWSRRDTAAFRP